MDKKIGKLIFLLLMCVTSSIYAAITLRMTDMQGYELEQVAAGQPFTVEVVITDIGSHASAPAIQGESRITLQQRGQHVTTINGKTTVKYIYQARIDEPGTYTLGPATVVQGGQTNSSNPLEIIVGTTQKTSDKQRKKMSDEVLFELSLDKKHLFVGEATHATLTFYYADDTVSLKNLMPPALDGFTVYGDVNTYTTGQATIKNAIYNYVRWEWQLSPTKVGTLTVPAYGAEYEKLASNTNQFGFGLFFLGRASERMRAYSNAITVQVDPLPAYHGLVTAIGVFKQVTATIEPSVAQEGEALVLALEFEGDGNLDAIKTPQLHALPDALKYYDSKHAIIPGDKNQYAKKRFEYIVQGLRAGTWQIPAQEFVIFDVEKKAYKTYKTKPLTITITPSGVKQGAQATHNATDQKNGDIEKSNDMTSDVLLAIDETGSWYRASEHAPLPLWLFVLLSMLPGIGVVATMVWRMIKKRTALHEPTVRAKKAFAYARDALQKAQRANEVTRIYPIFIQLFADRCKIDIRYVTQDFIEAAVRKAGLSPIECTQWHDFCMQIIEATYGHKTIENSSLFSKAQQWIDKLENVL